MRGKLLIDGVFVSGALRIENGRIAAIERVDAAPDQPFIVPGLVDLHVHGFGGHEPTEDLAGMARALAAHGTTAFLPTLFPDEPARLGATAERVARDARAAFDAGGARPLGLHLEGPFVNPARAGALSPAALAEPSVEALAALLEPSSGAERGVRIVTLAPELPGAAPLIEELVRAGVHVSLGHSLATAAEARGAARAGAAGATHLYNAMGPLHHRDAGLANFALSDDALYAEIIGDLQHVGSEAFALALRARGARGLCLVSDALAGAGSGCQVFETHVHRCRSADGAAWIVDDDPDAPPRLAGSVTSQLEAVRRLVRAGVVSLEEALTMASETPARALGVEADLGRITVGARADLLVLRGSALELERVLVGGR
ncbi:MAG: N-acetylglucosamine-6-phosphate deacetylase [Planctomycetota bacterium]